MWIQEQAIKSSRFVWCMAIALAKNVNGLSLPNEIHNAVTELNQPATAPASTSPQTAPASPNETTFRNEIFHSEICNMVLIQLIFDNILWWELFWCGLGHVRIEFKSSMFDGDSRVRRRWDDCQWEEHRWHLFLSIDRSVGRSIVWHTDLSPPSPAEDQPLNLLPEALSSFASTQCWTPIRAFQNSKIFYDPEIYAIR